MTQLDYDREMALILVDTDANSDIHAVVRLSADPDRSQAEFAIIVGHWLTGKGIGTLLMNRLIHYARGQGIGELYGSVLAENDSMLRLCRRLGFTIETDTTDKSTVIVRLNLTGL